MEALRSLASCWKPSLSVRLLFLLVPLVPASTCLAQAADWQTEAAVEPVQPGIWRLDGITPGLPSTDLEPLRKKIGKATVVALGESQHTSGGYYVAKHRIFRDLVERAGFRAIGFESPWSTAEALSSYVKTCKGSPEEALLGIDPFWQSAEVLDLVRWMCDWNRKHKKPKDRLDLFGFDVQQPEADGPSLIAFLARIGVPGDDPLATGAGRCNGVSGPRAPRGQVQAGDHAACMAALDAIAQRFDSDSKEIIKRTSKKDFDWAKVRLVSLRSWQGFTFYNGSDFKRADEERDAGMTYVLLAMQSLRLPKKTKLATWAHNFHISKAPMEDPNGFASTMGTYLAGALGSKYLAIGFISSTANYDNPGRCGTIRAAAGSLESRLHGLGEDYLLVDTAVGSPVLDPGSALLVSGFNLVPRDHYDALVYLDESPKMIPLHRPPC